MGPSFVACQNLEGYIHHGSWWFRNQAWKPVEVANFSHDFQGFWHPNGGCLGYFPSTVALELSNLRLGFHSEGFSGFPGEISGQILPKLRILGTSMDFISNHYHLSWLHLSVWLHLLIQIASRELTSPPDVWHIGRWFSFFPGGIC